MADHKTAPATLPPGRAPTPKPTAAPPPPAATSCSGAPAPAPPPAPPPPALLDFSGLADAVAIRTAAEVVKGLTGPAAPMTQPQVFQVAGDLADVIASAKAQEWAKLGSDLRRLAADFGLTISSEAVEVLMRGFVGREGS